MIQWDSDFLGFDPVYRKKNAVHRTRFRQGKLSIKKQIEILTDKGYINEQIPSAEALEYAKTISVLWDQLPLPIQFEFKEQLHAFLRSYALGMIVFNLEFVNQIKKELQGQFDVLIVPYTSKLLTINQCVKYIKLSVIEMDEDWIEKNRKFISKLDNKTLSISLVDDLIRDFGFKEVVKGSMIYGKLN